MLATLHDRSRRDVIATRVCSILASMFIISYHFIVRSPRALQVSRCCFFVLRPLTAAIRRVRFPVLTKLSVCLYFHYRMWQPSVRNLFKSAIKITYQTSWIPENRKHGVFFFFFLNTKSVPMEGWTSEYLSILSLCIILRTTNSCRDKHKYFAYFYRRIWPKKFQSTINVIPIMFRWHRKLLIMS